MSQTTLVRQSGALMGFARPKSPHPRGEDTRRRILETAIEMFATEGYEGTGTRELAQRAAVNLPAIQYYFGNKEGLYRAVIGHIVEQTETTLAPVAAQVNAALGHKDATREELIEALCAMLATFVALVCGGPHLKSRRLLFARAEIDRTAELDSLHECGMRQIYQPCLSLVSRLTGLPKKAEEAVLRTLLLLGQVTIFCNKGVQHALKTTEFSAPLVHAIQALVRRHTMSIFAMPAKPGHRRPSSGRTRLPARRRVPA